MRRYGQGRRCWFERVEERRLLAFDFLNSFNPCDVNNDGFLSPVDALLIINELHAAGARDLTASAVRPAQFWDANGDGRLESQDAQLVLTQLNASAVNATPLTITAKLAQQADEDGNGVVLRSPVSLVGQTLPAANVRLTVDSAPSAAETQFVMIDLRTVADATGHFQFDVSLPTGATTFKLAARDAADRGAVTRTDVRYGDAILNTNATLLNVVRGATDPPPRVARNMAMVHTAMFDAVNSIQRDYAPYLAQVAASPDASTVAAAVAAAHRVASQLYSGEQELATFNAMLSETLATVPSGAAKDAGLAVGRQVADAILAARANDGASATVAGPTSNNPGDWSPTAPDFLPPLLPQWPNVTPFAMTSGSQFRPTAPPALTSADYANAVDEVLQFGAINSVARTADQTVIAKFWADGGGTFTPPGHWNQIAADVALTRNNSFAENTRLFALLNVALADAGISAWDTKYHFNLWRPIDAIREADTDGNSQTLVDRTWTPLLKTPPFSTYTSGHSTFSGAAAAILTRLYGDHFELAVTADPHANLPQRSPTESPLTTRSYASFETAANEAGRSRIYGGIHFEFDNAAGLAAGKSLGEYVFANVLKPRIS